MRRAAALLLALVSPQVIGAPLLVLEPVQDNTLYETAIDVGETQNERSNGAGDFLFAGRAGFDTGFKRRRAVLRFDLSALPAGARILSAELTLYQSRAAPDSPPATMRLYRVLQEWGEGTSDGIGPEGQGDFPTAGDATWHHAVYPDVAWTAAGGNFAVSESAAVVVGQLEGFYTFACTGSLVADLGLWQSDPLTNFGWIMIGGEDGGQSAHRFNSRESPTPEQRPRLAIRYLPAGTVLSDGFEEEPACN